jgi:hypothetical protein
VDLQSRFRTKWAILDALAPERARSSQRGPRKEECVSERKSLEKPVDLTRLLEIVSAHCGEPALGILPSSGAGAS